MVREKLTGRTRVCDTRSRLIQFDGSNEHWVIKYYGKRFSLFFFKCRTALHAKERFGALLECYGFPSLRRLHV